MGELSRESEPDAPLVAIRDARRGDVDALVELETASFTSDRLSRRSLMRLIGVRSAVVLVAEAGGSIVGSVVILLRSYSDRARLYSLAVSTAARGAGLGSALIEAACRAATGRGASMLTLEVREDNRSAQRLYERLGFAFVGLTAGYYSDGEAALHFRRSLLRTQPDEGRAAEDKAAKGRAA